MKWLYKLIKHEHKFVKTGHWTDNSYHCHPIFKCSKCGKELWDEL